MPKVRIIEIVPVGIVDREFLAVGTEHEVIEPPKKYAKSKIVGTWVQGATEPVKLLKHEFEFIK